ncbi:MAG: hypothetical protein LWW75_07905, partial [Chlorobiales bacterium]|nr:hypothetical protein [Chlorobiales bacterium]
GINAKHIGESLLRQPQEIEKNIPPLVMLSGAKHDNQINEMGVGELSVYPVPKAFGTGLLKKISYK